MGLRSKWSISEVLLHIVVIARQPDRGSLHPPRTLRPADFYICWDLLKQKSPGRRVLGGAEIPYLAAGLLPTSGGILQLV